MGARSTSSKAHTMRSRPGKVRSSAAKARVGQVAAQLRGQPDVARVVSYYDAHHPAMVSRDGRSTYVLAYFKPVSDKAQQDAAGQIQRRASRRPATPAHRTPRRSRSGSSARAGS